MSMRSLPFRYSLFLASILGLAISVRADVTEDFDGWNDDGQYAGISSYDHAGVGIWVSENSLSSTQNARSGYALRMNDDSDPPWLDFRGLDGNGLDGGVGTVSFYYRHWNGDGSPVAFQLQYRVNGGGFTNVGSEVAVTSVSYALFSRSVDLTSDNVIIRILSTTNDERLLIDDFELTSNGSTQPGRVEANFGTPHLSVSESSATVQVPVHITRPANVALDIVAAGTASPGADYSIFPTSLTFSATGATSQLVTITLVDDPTPEETETISLTLANLVGADAGTNDAITISINDNEDTTITIMAANTTSGNFQAYEASGIRIFQALAPDIVGIQEFNVDNPGGRRGFVDDVFGTNFHYMVEAGSESIPNGIISRWPITASGEWDDPQVNNRDFAWATIDIPGDVDLHVVSVHLHNSGGSSSRLAEARVLTNRIQTSFPPTDYIVVTGDFNTESRTESAVQTLKTLLSDTHVPVSRDSDDDTNANRNKPYDWVLPNSPLDLRHESISVGGVAFPNGIVFDTREWSPPPAPALTDDSGASMMQHMAVMKAFSIPGTTAGSVTLTVSSPHGTPVPPVGATAYASGAVLAPSVPGAGMIQGSTQYVVSGWSGTGSAPASGSGAIIPSFSITEPSTVTWRWNTNYLLTASTAAGGSVNPTSAWVLAGTSVPVSATPPTYYHFAQWIGDVPPAEDTDNPVFLTMDQPRSVIAAFAPDLAARGTPHEWMAQFGYTNDFDTAEGLDEDEDGFAVWQEYITGTSPSADGSRLHVSLIDHSGPLDIQVPTQPDRQYTIEYSDDVTTQPTNPTWTAFANPARGTYEESGPTPSTHTFVDDFGPDTTGAPPPDGVRVYRIRAALLP